jgi:hypothetical protein
MQFEQFLERVIEAGIEGAKHSYRKPEDEYKLRGSINGFEACRGKSITELGQLLKDSREQTHAALMQVHKAEILPEDYWQIRCSGLEVEWVCNCVSALIFLRPDMLAGNDVLVAPTVRAVMLVQNILRGPVAS